MQKKVKQSVSRFSPVTQKRGSESWFTVSLIIVFISLGVLLLILLNFNLKGNVDRTACHESALIRGTLPDGAIVDKLKDTVSLRCQTKRICVTTKKIGKGECENELGNKFVTYRISGTIEAKSDQIRSIMAREMAECWTTLGEGNLNIFKRELSSSNSKLNGKVVVCSRVAFDKNVLKEIPKVDRMSPYLLTHKVPGKEISYWDYLRNAPDGDSLQALNGNPIKTSEVNDNLNLKEQKAVFYLESTISSDGADFGAGAGLLFGVLGTGALKGAGILGKGLSGGGIAVLGTTTYVSARLGDAFWKKYFADGIDSDGHVSGIFLTDYNKDGFEIFKNQNIEFENIP